MGYIAGFNKEDNKKTFVVDFGQLYEPDLDKLEKEEEEGINPEKDTKEEE